MKALERVWAWRLEESALIQNPLSCDQHAFWKGYSTDSALSTMVEYAESAIIQNKFTIDVFLCIQGAFDNVSIPTTTPPIWAARMWRKTGAGTQNLCHHDKFGGAGAAPTAHGRCMGGTCGALAAQAGAGSAGQHKTSSKFFNVFCLWQSPHLGTVEVVVVVVGGGGGPFSLSTTILLLFQLLKKERLKISSAGHLSNKTTIFTPCNKKIMTFFFSYKKL